MHNMASLNLSNVVPSCANSLLGYKHTKHRGFSFLLILRIALSFFEGHRDYGSVGQHLHLDVSSSLFAPQNDSSDTVNFQIAASRVPVIHQEGDTAVHGMLNGVRRVPASVKVNSPLKYIRDSSAEWRDPDKSRSQWTMSYNESQEIIKKPIKNTNWTYKSKPASCLLPFEASILKNVFYWCSEATHHQKYASKDRWCAFDWCIYICGNTVFSMHIMCAFILKHSAASASEENLEQ